MTEANNTPETSAAAPQQINVEQTQALLNVLEQQRNAALNANAQLAAQIQVLQGQLGQAIALLKQHGILQDAAPASEGEAAPAVNNA